MFNTFVGKSLAMKVIYTELLIVSRVKVRSKILWQEKLGGTVPWSKIYLLCYKGFSTNPEHNVFFKVFHYVFKTGEYFCSWNCFHISLDCSYCLGQLETLEHLFLAVPLQRRSGVGRPLFCKLLGEPGFVPSLQTLIGLDGLCEGLSHVDPDAGSLLFQADRILFAIWHFRKKKCFEKVVCTAHDAISLVEFSFK